MICLPENKFLDNFNTNYLVVNVDLLERERERETQAYTLI